MVTRLEGRVEPGAELFGSFVHGLPDGIEDFGHGGGSGEGTRSVGVDENGVGFIGRRFIAIVELVPVALLRVVCSCDLAADWVFFSRSAFFLKGLEGWDFELVWDGCSG